MSLEIEKKYRLTEERRAQIVRELPGMGAVFEGEDQEENIIYRGPILIDASIVRIFG